MLRPACPDDLPTLHALILALARFEHLEHEVTGTVDDLGEHLFGARPRAEVILADDGGTVVGFALFFHNFSTFLARPGLYLEDLFVLPEHRRRGWGKRLLRELGRIAVERGCGRFEWSVLHWNEDAIAFYRSLGAQPMDDWRIMRVTGEALAKLAAG